MRSTQIPSSGPPSQTPGIWVPIRLVASDVGGIGPSEQEVLATADVIFCEQDADIASLALAAPRALIEQVRGNVSMTRARGLANDGWRVVWLTSEGRAASPAACDEAGPGREDGGAELSAARSYEPHPLATAFNGLAG
jgi:hypothetical protein